MQGKYILLVLIALLVILPPCMASTKTIAQGAPVFVGETGVDINKALASCRIIGWWPAGSDMAQPPEKSITLRALNEISPALSKYTFNFDEYANHTGTWYCVEKQPHYAVFDVREPEIAIRVWDLDSDSDVTGTTVPVKANITYRIDTNLDTALQLKYRPDKTLADSFMTVKLTNPSGKGITNIYTDSYGAKNVQILTFDSNPMVESSPYYWRAGADWNRASRDLQGTVLYPPGTYTFTLNQNLNGMQDTYKAAGITEAEGILTSTATITFEEPAVTTPAPTTEVPLQTPETTAAPEITVTGTVPIIGQTETPVPERTTYAPLPGWIAFAALAIAGSALCSRKK